MIRELGVHETASKQQWKSASLMVAITVVAGLLRAWQMANQGSKAWLAPIPWPTVLLPHLVGEIFMATVPALGAVAWWRGYRWGASIMLLGLGAALYASLNATGWALATRPVLAIGMVLGFVVALAVCLHLIRHPGAVFAPRTWRRSLLALWLVAGTLQIVGLWVVLFVTGAVGSPLVVRIDFGYIGFRNVGELLMVSAGGASAWAWRRRLVGWPELTLSTLGMFLYAAVNTFGEAILVSKLWAAIELFVLVAGIGLALRCLRDPQTRHRVPDGHAWTGWSARG